MGLFAPISLGIPQRRFVLVLVLAIASTALGLQRAHIRQRNRQHADAMLLRITAAVQCIETSEKRNYRGTLYPHQSTPPHVQRDPGYGGGDEANTFLVDAKPLQIGEKIQMRMADLHWCPNGLGACSYSGMLEITVDNGLPIVVDVFGIGSNDANWFSVRNGAAAMQDIAAAVATDLGDSYFSALAPPTQADFQRAIKQCWQHRNGGEPAAEGKPSCRETTRQELAGCIFRAIYHQWRNEHSS